MDIYEQEQPDGRTFRTISGEQLLQGNRSISHKQAVDKATDEYKKYKARTLSTVEEDYLNSIKILEKKQIKKKCGVEVGKMFLQRRKIK